MSQPISKLWLIGNCFLIAYLRYFQLLAESWHCLVEVDRKCGPNQIAERHMIFREIERHREVLHTLRNGIARLSTSGPAVGIRQQKRSGRLAN